MPGWIIQGVRGEGKSLCAVGKIKEYLEQGRPVATNLDLYLDKLLPEYTNTPCYRLPDHPRIQDFELLPPAYDLDYKGEDRNGLLVLDELGTWLNSRSWNDKSRAPILNWLFLSRKLHWDLILLAQDVDMIDAQVRTTCCDYLVQSSRLDRQKIPYLGKILHMFGLNSYMPKIHVYFVFYGLNTQSAPQEKWQFTGRDYYAGYDTNQRFRDGKEFLGNSLVDMRATYSYLPPAITTRYKFIKAFEDKIQALRDIKPLDSKLEQIEMAVKKSASTLQAKGILLIAFAVIFLIYKGVSGGFSVPTKGSATAAAVSAVPAVVAPVVPVSSPSVVPVSDVAVAAVSVPDVTKQAVEVDAFLLTLLKTYRPRLSSFAFSDDTGFLGFVEFYDGATIVERIDMQALHFLGAALVKAPFGAFLHFNGIRYALTSWPKQTFNNAQHIQVAKNP